MTFDECYEQVILPTYMRLKEEHEKISIDHNAHIHTTGNKHCLDFTVMEDDRVLTWRLKIGKSEDNVGYIFMGGDALYSECAAGYLTTEIIAIDKLTPFDIEFKICHANILLGQTDGLSTHDKLKAVMMRQNDGE